MRRAAKCVPRRVDAAPHWGDTIEGHWAAAFAEGCTIATGEYIE